MILEIKNDSLNVSFSVDFVENMSQLYRSVMEVIVQKVKDESKHFSYSGFAKVMNDKAHSVKGWRFTISDPVCSNSNQTERNVAKREEKRASKKQHKKALKAAKRNIANGNRNRLGAQERYVNAKKRPQLNPILKAMIS